jgi:hypothetical protein
MATAINEFFSIDTFRQKLNGGSKANLFRIIIEPDEAITGVDLSNLSILCKSGAIPAFTLGVIEVPFRGRRIKIPGDRTYADWTATIVNDDAQAVRISFDNWLNSIIDVNGENDLRTGTDSYRATIKVQQLRPDGTVARVYELYDAFPTDVSAIDLSYDTTDAIQEFTVTFQYHYLDVGGTSAAGVDAGNPGASTSSASSAGSSKDKATTAAK